MGIVVEKMRSSWLSVVRSMTSSRQSPSRSTLRAGVDLVPLLEEHPSAVKITSSVSFSQFHFEIRLPLRISRRRSPSHQTPKLHEAGFFSEIFSPFTL